MSLFNPKQPFLFDESKEHIRKQISAITPMSVVYPEAQRQKIADDIESGRRKVFESDGVMGLVSSKEDAAYLARVMARLKYGSNHILFNDLASGLYTAYTRKELFAEEPRRLIDQKTGKVVKTVFTLSHDAVFKLMMGPLVNEKGRAITGAGPVVGQIKDQILPILRGEEVEPIACCSIQRYKDGKLIEAAVFGKPIIVDTWTTNAARIMLDNAFFPLLEYEAKAGDKYLNQVAGLGAFLSFGRYILKQQGEKGFPQTPDAHKLILSIQAAFEMQGFAPGIVRENRLGRNNVIFRRAAVQSLRPDAMASTGRINFKAFSDFVATVGRMYRAALDETGIEDQLPDKVLVPATDRGAEFPAYNKRIVFVKVDSARKPAPPVPSDF